MSTAAEIAEAIDRLDPKEQIKLLQCLPAHLKINLEDLGWSQLGESAFGFWDNPDDAIYDHL
jgi:hypothetical protein